MKAVVWHGTEDVRVDEVPDPTIQEPTDAIVRITSTAICGSDLHLYEVLGTFMDEGDILGHEPMGIVEEVGAEVTHIKAGDRVVIPFNISCGSCFMCDQELYSQCETTQVREYGKGAVAVRLLEAVRRRCPAGRPSSCGCRRRSSARSRSPKGRPTSASSTSPTCCRPHGRPSPTPTMPEAARSPCSGSGRSATVSRSDRPALGRRACDRGRPRSRAPRAWRGSTGVEVVDVRRTTSIVDDDPRAHRRPRPRLPSSTRSGWRPTAHRLPRRPSRLVGAAARRGRRGRSWRRSASTGLRRCTPRSTPCAAAARSRSSASTAAPPTRCR